MTKRLLEYDPDSKTHTWHEYDHMTKETIITESQDVEYYLKRNRAMFNDADFKQHGFKEEYVKIASLPNSIIMKWKRELGVDVYDRNDEKKVFKLLNDPEYRYLRTVSGKY